MLKTTTFFLPTPLFIASIACISIKPVMGTETGAETTQKIKVLRGIYDQNYAFPAWVIGFSQDEEYQACCKSVKIYALKGSKKETILKMYTQRDPVNIGMSQEYNKEEMKQKFGYDESFYSAYYKEHKILPPQTILCCRTPVIWHETQDYEKEAFPRDKAKYVTVINVIGAGLDDNNQPDYKHFISEDGKITDTKKEELRNFYTNIFNMVFQYLCDEKKFKRVVLTKFGCNAFAQKYPGGGEAFVNQVWTPALQASLDQYAERLKKVDLEEIAFTGKSSTQPKELQSLIKTKGFSTAVYGWLPHTFCPASKCATKLSKKEERDGTAFINAYDPHSLLGNGNKNDNSLDGWWGRCSGMAPLGWTHTNPFLTENSIHYVDPPNSLEDETGDDGNVNITQGHAMIAFCMIIATLLIYDIIKTKGMSQAPQKDIS